MKLNGRGLTGTIIYHALLLALLLFAGLTYPDPPPEEEGILVNFGTDEFGLGDYEPMGDDQQAGDPLQAEVTQAQEPVEELVEDAQPVVETRQTTPPPRPVEVDQTQDVEETRVKEAPKPTPEELERQRQAELERQRLEQERIERERREEQERIAREEQERIERERQQQAERLNNLGRNAFGNQGVGQTEGSEGVTQGSGNQGDPNGSPDSDNYGTGGGLGDGISFGGLGSRRALGNLPKPNMSGCDVTQKITVQVEVQVDRNGNVVSAIVTNSTYQNKCIWDMVVEAATKSKFSVDQNANYRQTGWIRYIITP
jgi:outer membrane biosynthesis protein TonB